MQLWRAVRYFEIVTYAHFNNRENVQKAKQKEISRKDVSWTIQARSTFSIESKINLLWCEPKAALILSPIFGKGWF